MKASQQKYLEKLLETPVFRHTGIVNADEETLRWAEQQEAKSSFPMYPCQSCIHWDDQAQKICIGDLTLMVVFTDGSANATNTGYLAHGGWGYYLHAASEQNMGGPLTGKPITSYRAEVRAVLEVVWRTRVPTCIVTDCKSVWTTIEAILGQINKGEQAVWPDDDGCNDYWETMAEILNQKYTTVIVKWMPSHLDEEGRTAQKTAFVANGGDQGWIPGNCGL